MALLMFKSILKCRLYKAGTNMKQYKLHNMVYSQASLSGNNNSTSSINGFLCKSLLSLLFHSYILVYLKAIGRYRSDCTLSTLLHIILCPLLSVITNCQCKLCYKHNVKNSKQYRSLYAGIQNGVVEKNISHHFEKFKVFGNML